MESEEKFIIRGGRELRGTVKVSGSKNASLPIIFASILTGSLTLHNVPRLTDVFTACKLLEAMGFHTSFSGNTLKVSFSGDLNPVAPYELVIAMRASILTLGPLLARYGRGKVFLPGGCAIGVRPVDLHLKGLSRLGADIKVYHGFIVGEVKGRLKGAEIYFDFPTVGGTENVLMAAVLAEGKTVIRNAAKEPEIVDLARALKRAGAVIEGEGTDVIEVWGVDELSPFEYTVMPDRIEAGTFMSAVAAAGGDVVIEDFPSYALKAVVDKFSEAGLVVEELPGSKVRVVKRERLRGTDIVTQPYPGFPTDMQAQFMAAMCLAEGDSVIRETIFENRFMHVPELQRLGANLKVDGNTVFVRGVEELVGAKVTATDLRASASLVIAGLAAKNTTEVYKICHLDRGYEQMEVKLRALGADIERVKEKEEQFGEGNVCPS
ncbi:UDP-N-acetylglucosamine 1-carboxyvinyltransferase [Thermovibrio ammonificans]|jgi:UDP-N-acetylglucosamine 1-carboxyvinyltransferase|uniref:UDP-N-acetylglucosamine 1-carboxyvinyltransferase n=1 Tax=Thermovibrio ammonificans (strain DSM 15698 / JCM 12110 / HB-1) TaxID=648996 RepID=E8T6K7_THEA1|nr:UDP-N-acetylglucosamine 1-carboxyvinyltransferase [Thermovibrio ammonificans]ADU96791.1 UDP-N-acetylglucosamine 1-carboxyvinyltransferase [Thermovibrio ammonificans HB-1]